MIWLRLRKTVLAGLSLSALLIAAACVLPLFPDVHWVLELPGHFRVQLFVVCIAIMLGMAALRAWWRAAALALLALLVMLPVLTLFAPNQAGGDDGLDGLKLLVINVNTANRDHDAVVDLVRETLPDIVALTEVNARWLLALDALEDHYPNRTAESREDNFGIALLSRFPLRDVEVRSLGRVGVPFIVASLYFRGQPITIVVAHPLPPAGSGYTAARNQQLEQLSRLRQEFDDTEMMFVGDLNTTPWSRVFLRLLERTGLRNGAVGFGYQPTWPAQIPLMRIPIDHCLVSTGISVRKFEVGSALGSDHLPISIEIGVRRDAARSVSKRKADGADSGLQESRAGQQVSRVRRNILEQREAEPLEHGDARSVPSLHARPDFLHG